ncbi:MAG: uracil-DNA glycosylase [Acidobacteria bacterium]|nr:uracil-DNA glycosylase [Acidobacteriota bacterium]
MLATDPLALVAPDWAAALASVEPALRALGSWLQEEHDAGRGFLPRPSHVLRAFALPLSEQRVLIVGQDPYPTPGHAVGLSFSTDPAVRPLPRSLRNIYAELESDLGISPAPHGDLTPWAHQGVLLLNRVLTVAPGQAGSHAKKGWEAITEVAIKALAARPQPLVAILWGNQAQTLEPLLAGHDVITSAHPSPLSARRGFFGSKPFSRTNELLLSRGGQPINWQLTQGWEQPSLDVVTPLG